MREIKFRIWDVKEKEFIVNKEAILYCGDTKKCMSERIDFENNSVEISANESYIFLQYTGLKDKNGKEIYEGDILLDEKNYQYCHIRFDEGCFIADFEAYTYDLFYVMNTLEVEVMGNIYEDPELLEGDDE